MPQISCILVTRHQGNTYFLLFKDFANPSLTLAIIGRKKRKIRSAGLSLEKKKLLITNKMFRILMKYFKINDHIFDNFVFLNISHFLYIKILFDIYILRFMKGKASLCISYPNTLSINMSVNPEVSFSLLALQ